VLQPFIQVDTALSRKYEGTGLGLTLTRSLVELHDGALQIESELDKGTTVRVVFGKDRVLAIPIGSKPAITEASAPCVPALPARRTASGGSSSGGAAV
jgi:two-component system cell cycle sensor histidine kinase PleC